MIENIVSSPDRDSMNDEVLVSLISEGDKKAFAVIARRHGGRFRALAFRFVGDMALAEDLVQEAFVKLWTHADRFNSSKAKFTTWFHRIIVNRCLDEKRKRTLDALPDGFDQPDDTPRADVQIGNNAAAARLNVVLKKLSERQRIAVTLSYLEELSNQEAAEVMGLKLKAFESLLLRSRANMRKMLIADKTDLLSAFS